MTTNQCPICKEPFDQSPFVATVDGEQQCICRDCAKGMRDGLDILSREGVTHESTDPSHEK
jgi:ribosome-binding protein aMBF1 (putative translation factor)